MTNVLPPLRPQASSGLPAMHVARERFAAACFMVVVD
jgi:hypothetical protein